MAEMYYSTQPFLAWSLNHFFHGRRHFSYFAAPFHPYRLPNPTSSNPWKQYGLQYEPWVDADPYDSVAIQKRVALARGVAANHRLPAILQSVLHFVCDAVDPVFLLPIVYRVDLSAIDPARRKLAGSGSVGSNEHLIEDLREHEFDVLFFDPVSNPHMTDPDVEDLGDFLRTGTDTLTSTQALIRLLGRC